MNANIPNSTHSTARLEPLTVLLLLKSVVAPTTVAVMLFLFMEL